MFSWVSSIRKSLDFFNLIRKIYLYVLPVAFKTQSVISPANPGLVLTVVQSSINLTGFIAFVLLELKNAVEP